ncbi:MAG: acyl-CoA transferase/carnitine dehydratase [Ramlibacter sp.]|nr:acyl-CoA transferase/carnitine dehydratase [Ramlibacter sp.]
MQSLLDGVKVLELTGLMAGPTCGMLLADMGADVAKIEKVQGGDDLRAFGVPGALLNAPFVMINRNKRGIAVDFKQEEGRALVKRMASQADVVVENYRPGALDKMGLGYEQLAAINPRLVYASISGWGAKGPWAGRGGFDLMAQGFAGIMSVTGEEGGPPMKNGNSVADINGGILAAVGILGALFQRERTGLGQQLETSLLDASLQQMYWFAAVYFQTGQIVGASGSGHPLTSPYQAFKTSDGWVTLGGASQPNWERIAKLLEHPEWCTDERFVTAGLRKKNNSALADRISAELVKKPSAHWMALFDSAGVPVGPVHNIAQALAHPQTLAEDRVVEVEHPIAGRSRVMPLPIRFSGADTSVHRSAPLLGEHTRELLGEYGLEAAEIDSLIDRGVVAEMALPADELFATQAMRESAPGSARQVP